MVNCVRILNTYTVRILFLQFVVAVLPGIKFGCIAFSEKRSHSQLTVPQTRTAQFEQSYQETVNLCSQVVFKYNYLEFGNKTTAVRITVKNLSYVDPNSPVQFVARQKQGIMSCYAYYTVSRTLCPLDAASRTNTTTQQTIYLDISTMEERNVSFIAEAVHVPSFLLRTNTKLSLNITPSESQYYMYTFPDDVDSVVVTATSNDDLCMTLSVQDFQCPVLDLDRNMKFHGAHQTMTRQAAITVKKSKHVNHSFFVVMVLKPKDTKCHGVKNRDLSNGTRTKAVSIKIVPAATATVYYVAILITISVFIGFSAVAYVIYHTYCKMILKQMKASQKETCTSGGTNSNVEEGVPLLSTMIDPKKEDNRKRKFIAYCSNLAAISIFYGLPVLQLVLTQQKVLLRSGFEDFCYYNFECARPLGVFSSFNNVFSNIGYVFLGMLFIILVWRRNKVVKIEDEQNRGIIQCNGLFYSMGLALCIEGVMSACYHICPNYLNFQYDTSFMYIIASLCMVRIYQNRHPDIAPKSDKSFLLLSFVMVIAYLGMVIPSNVLWAICWLLNILVVLRISFWMYYMGHQNVHINCQMFAKMYNYVVRERQLCSKPKYSKRLSLIVTGATFDLLYATIGLFYRPHDFASFLLGKFIGNVLLYTLYYIFMKISHGEKIQPLTSFCILATSILWGFALYFFFANLTSWQLTPSRSRERNRPCLVLDFFDKHDVWHFLSAISMFFSFMILLTVDDDLLTTRRDKILVF